MVGNYTFAGLVTKLRDEAEMKMDYIVPSSRARMEADEMFTFNDHAFNMNPIAHTQLATKLQIPSGFYNRMQEYPGLRTSVVNRLMESDGRSQMARTMGGQLRAVLSDRYKPIENLDVLNAASPVLRDMEVNIVASSLTESRMYLQVTFPRMKADVAVGDAVQYGLTISNSEVGMGMVKVSPTVWRLVCSNGMIRKAEIKHRHIGKQLGVNEDHTVYSDEAKEAEDKAFKLKLRDAIQASVSESSFAFWVDQMKGAVSDPIDDVVKTVKRTQAKFNLDASLEELMVNNIAHEGNLNRWGLANSITYLAHETEDRDKQYEYEAIGDHIISMNYKEWKEVAA